MLSTQSILTFFNSPGPILDIRSPCEYSQGYIPGAINLPLFSDTERSDVGTTYKQIGRDEAVELGLKFVLPKLDNLTKEAFKYAREGYARIHCWRGGMRSAAISKHLAENGLEVVVLYGGYKAFRKWALEQFQKPYRLSILGGFTGSGKTATLHALQDSGEQILDLEALAGHRGSSFGLLGKGPQPTCEQFENEIAFNLMRINPSKPLWVEDESRMIGRCKIPDPFWNSMQNSPLFLMEKPLEERIEQLLKDYGSFFRHELVESVKRIEKRLGGARTKEIVHKINNEDLKGAAEILLHHYDSTYTYNLQKRKSNHNPFFRANFSHQDWATLLR